MIIRQEQRLDKEFWAIKYNATRVTLNSIYRGILVLVISDMIIAKFAIGLIL